MILGDCLVTGGAGFFGSGMVGALLARPDVGRVIVFSRDPEKHRKLRERFPDNAPNSRMRYFIGDVRDRDRLRRAFHGVSTVIHAAALKDVPAGEYNPLEVVQTNIVGSCNVLDAAIDAGVRRLLGLSSDKAVQPLNVYGDSKAVMEGVFVAGNAYVGGGATRIAIVRWGNVAGSTGSILPIFCAQRESGVLTVTDRRMTRFWIGLRTAADFALWCLDHMKGGERFVPKMSSARMVDIARAIGPECVVRETGIRPGEKLHEALIAPDEVRQTLDVGRCYLIQPAQDWWTVEGWEGATPVPYGFRYSSDSPEALSNVQWEERRA